MNEQSAEEKYIAHVKEHDSSIQTLQAHLIEVSKLAGNFASKLGLEKCGQLVGLLHDFGKYSASFQKYICSATGLYNQDVDSDYVDASKLKGKIDHSTAGGQFIWQYLSGKLDYKSWKNNITSQILALCIVSHHSGLIDCYNQEGENVFIKRMLKEDRYSNYKECLVNADKNIKVLALQLCSDEVIDEIFVQLKKIRTITQIEKDGKNIQNCLIREFYLGLIIKFLFSCLIDADRQNSSDFEFPNQKLLRTVNVDWNIAVEAIEGFYKKYPPVKDIDHIRSDIANHCLKRSLEQQDIYTLSVPTGGGKTLAGFRFAIHHARKHNLEKIIYIAPFTTIIEQNSESISNLFERKTASDWVLEHHSNLEPENQSWKTKLASEDWSSPIIMTTMVQFLETIFSGGTRGVRRLHQLSNAVIIFDEIQAIPIKVIHLFCNAVNFLKDFAKSTIVLCTATQPLLHMLRYPEKGQINLSKTSEIITDKTALFDQLKRTKFINEVKHGGWQLEELVRFIMTVIAQQGNCLVVTNTKDWALKLYNSCAQIISEKSIFHLSTNQCPAHRKHIYKQIIEKLKHGEKVLCISTQLIEAGVDIDFNSVVRFCAGLDSLAQAAGRCNRNGLREISPVYIVNPAKENLDKLVDIKKARDIMLRILSENTIDDLLTPKIMEEYYKYYYFDRAEDMSYRIKAQGREESILNLLSENRFSVSPNNTGVIEAKQAFKLAGEHYKTINAPTRSLIVSYGKKGETLITELAGEEVKHNLKKYYLLIKQAQQYSVNIFPFIWDKLDSLGAIYEVAESVFCLKKEYYDKDFGLFVDSDNTQEFCMI